VGSGQAVVCAVRAPNVEYLAQRVGEPLDKALRTPDDDVGAVVEAIVRPAAELAASGWRGRACLLIVAELAGEDPARFSPELESVLARTGGNEVYAVLAARMPTVPQEILDERCSLITSFILRAVADRERAKARTTRPSRHVLDDERFVENLVAMVSAAVSTTWRV
jgi:hypothetical protein